MKKIILIGLIIELVLCSIVTAQQCFSDAQCANGGGWVSDSNKLVRYGCSNGYCEIVEEKVVECASSYACPEGTTCLDWKCVETGAVIGGGLIPKTCGNNLCESGEQEQNCPEDCNLKNQNTNIQESPNYILPAIIIVIGIIIGAIILKRKNKGVLQC